MTITCPACGEINDDGARFCEACGLGFRAASDDGAAEGGAAADGGAAAAGDGAVESEGGHDDGDAGLGTHALDVPELPDLATVTEQTATTDPEPTAAEPSSGTDPSPNEESLTSAAPSSTESPSSDEPSATAPSSVTEPSSADTGPEADPLDGVTREVRRSVAPVPVKVTDEPDGDDDENGEGDTDPVGVTPQTAPSRGRHATPSGTEPVTPDAPAAPLTTPAADEGPLRLPEELLAQAAGRPDARPCARCGGTIAADGYCEMCGEPAATERDHFRESPAPWVGGACDRGVVHDRNEDAMALGVLEPDGDVAVLVVCDGVSSAPDSDVASLAAARAASALVLDGIRNADAPSAEQIRDLSVLLGRAAHAGNDAVVETTSEDAAARENPPSCTFVAAAIDGPLVVTAWLGDSRAYWLPDEGHARQLSVDHSWAQEMIEQGMPRFEAERARHAHAITRWLGSDAPDLAVRTDAMVAGGPGWVMVCSDGLWNYCSPATDLQALLHATVERVGSDPTEVAGELVTWANGQGGRDNITVALARLEP